MTTKHFSLIVVAVFFCAIGLLVLERMTFESRVRSIADRREKEYCLQLVGKLNEQRKMMGQQPVSPNNFAEFLEFYLQGVADVMDEGLLKNEPEKPKAPAK